MDDIYIPICLKDGDIKFCEEPEYYVLNSKITPKPLGMVLFCLKKNGDGNTIYLRKKYDPFDKDDKCEKTFYAWISHPPNTVSIYLYKKEDRVLGSLNENENLERYFPVSINVLKNIPKGYISDKERCIPDLNGGETLLECMKRTKRDDIQPTILSLLKKDKKRGKNYLLIVFLIILILLFIYFISKYILYR